MQLSTDHLVRVTFFAGDSHMASFGKFNGYFNIPLPDGVVVRVPYNESCDHRYMASAVSSPIGVTPAPDSLATALNTAGELLLADPDADTMASLQSIFPGKDGAKPLVFWNRFLNTRHYMVVEDKNDGQSKLRLAWRFEREVSGFPVPATIFTVSQEIVPLQPSTEC